MAITFPRLNPIIFKEQQTSPFEQSSKTYFQKWNREDYIVFQVAYDDKAFTNGELSAILVDENDTPVANFTSDTITIPDGFQTIFRVSCNAADGCCRVKLTTATANLKFYSNPFLIGQHENTMLVRYMCKRNKFDCIFNTAEYLYYFFLRIEGNIKSGDVLYNADDIMYSSQERTTYLIDSIPYTTRKYTFGDSYGLPVWFAEKLNRIFACEIIHIDDIVVVKNDGAKLEPTSSDAYPYVGLKIELLHRNEGYSEELYSDAEAMLSGVVVELIDRDYSFSVMAEKTGRIHVATFQNTFN